MTHKAPQTTPLHDQIFEILGFHKTDAMSNLEAKRGCQWVNRLIVATIDALEQYETIQHFYYKQEYVDQSLMFSVFLEKPDGCLDCWKAACKACLEEKTPPNDDEAEVLDFAAGAFWQALNPISELKTQVFDLDDCSGVVSNMREVAEKDCDETRKALKRTIQEHTINIAETCYRLKIYEWEIWYAHRDWKVSWGWWEHDGPFDGRGAVKAFYPVLKAFDEKQPFAFQALRQGLHGLLNVSDLRPKAFVAKFDYTSQLSSFEREVFAILTMETQLEYKYPPELAAVMGYENETFVPSIFLMQSRHTFLVDLYESFYRKAEEPLSDATRRLWLEAAAKLLQNMSLHQPVYTREEADAIIALANQAQYESWIERMMERTKKKKVSNLASLILPPEQPEPMPARAKAVNEEAITEKLKAYVNGLLAGKKKTGGGKSTGEKSETHGRQTETMLKQFGRLQQYLNQNRVVLHCPLETLKRWVHGFWLANQAEFKEAAKAKGQDKGYGSEAMLLRAAVNKGYGQKPKKRVKQ